MQMLYTGLLLAVTMFYTTLATDGTEGILPETAVETEYVEEAEVYYDAGIAVRLEHNGEVLELPMDTYLTDVVLQEMPASFEMEALKAQCVAARTFTMRQIYYGGVHKDADICGDPACCQCYLSEAEGRAVYGADYDSSRTKVMEAVHATDGQVLVYGDTLIEAVYFSSTGDSTESAEAVWGGEVAYLQPVSSPEDHRVTERVVTFDEFRSILSEADLDGHPAGWFGEMHHTEGGAVETMTIGGQVYTGTALRSRFSLKSARFTIGITDNGVEFIVTGSGHGVGMSQYGANEMAASGREYGEILLHYYTEVELKQLY